MKAFKKKQHKTIKMWSRITNHKTELRMSHLTVCLILIGLGGYIVGCKGKATQDVREGGVTRSKSKIELARTYYTEQGKHAEAENILKKLIEETPNDDEAHLELARCYWAQGKHKEAEDIYNKTLQINSKNFNVYVDLGARYQIQGADNEKIESLYKKVEEINPNNEHANLEASRFYKQHGKHKKAKKLYKRAMEINPNRKWDEYEKW